MNTSQQSVGTLLKDWRQRRRLTQLDFAGNAQISTRHLSFIETGRSRPSREMLLHLAELLDVPLRERNVMLTAAGYASVYRESGLDDPALASARRAIDLVLKSHEPYPALAVDRHWNLIAANAGVTTMLSNVPAELLQPPVNVLRVSLHPDALASRILNLGEWRAHILGRLRRQVELSADKVLADLLTELSAYPAPAAPATIDHHGVVIPLQLATPAGNLSLLSTTTVFGTPIDIILSEIALECFYPADAHTLELMRAAHASGIC